MPSSIVMLFDQRAGAEYVLMVGHHQVGTGQIVVIPVDDIDGR
jgi:hypothetical protein